MSNGSKYLSQHQPKAERHRPGREPRPEAPYLGQREAGSPTPISTECPPSSHSSPTSFPEAKEEAETLLRRTRSSTGHLVGQGPVHALSHRDSNVSTPTPPQGTAAGSPAPAIRPEDPVGLRTVWARTLDRQAQFTAALAPHRTRCCSPTAAWPPVPETGV